MGGFLFLLASTEKDPKSHHAKKKKKMKRQDPTLEKLSDNLSSFGNPVRDFNSNLNDDDQRYTLDNDFYVNQRIYHQNRNKPYVDTYKSDYNVDMENSVKDVDLLNLEEDDTVISDVDDLSFQSSDDLDKSYNYFQRHKIVSRRVRSPNDDFNKKMMDLANTNPDEYAINFERTPTLKTNENGLLEEIVDRSKIDEKPLETDDDLLSIFDGQLDLESNYTGFLELLGKFFWYQKPTLNMKPFCIYIFFITVSVHSGEEKMMPMYSDYFTVLKPGPNASASSDSDLLQTIIMVSLYIHIFCFYSIIRNKIDLTYFILSGDCRSIDYSYNIIHHTLRCTWSQL